jgi:hypothetical protein
MPDGTAYQLDVRRWDAEPQKVQPHEQERVDANEDLCQCRERANHASRCSRWETGGQDSRSNARDGSTRENMRRYILGGWLLKSSVDRKSKYLCTHHSTRTSVLARRNTLMLLLTDTHLMMRSTKSKMEPTDVVSTMAMTGRAKGVKYALDARSLPMGSTESNSATSTGGKDGQARPRARD